MTADDDRLPPEAQLPAAPAPQAKLPRPGGARLATLPRTPHAKPQEPSVAVNPRDPRHVIVSWHEAVTRGSDHHPGARVEVRVAWSVDGGETWAPAEGTSHPTHRVSIDASVAFDARGTAYLVYIGFDEIGNVATTRQGEYVARSTDGGRTWSAPVCLVERAEGDPVFEHMPYVCAVGHTTFAQWDRALADGTGTNVTVRSTDGGASWSEPALLGTRAARMTMGAASDGTIYLLHAAYEGGSWDATSLFVSRDGGLSFDDPLPAPRAVPTDGPVPIAGLPSFPRSCGWPVLAVDPRDSGRLFLGFGDFRHGSRDILSATSTDGGRTWCEPVRVNDDPVGSGRDKLMQSIAVDPADGAAYLLFYDRRDDSENVLAAATLARSTDGGRTFVNYRWSDEVSNPLETCLGDYLGLASLDGRVYAAWTESVRGEMEPAADELAPGRLFPYGPAAIRVGCADFRQ
jgi:hypothetical protein